MKYKIIIPQEEPKYTTSNLDNEKYKDYSVSKEEPKQETLEEHYLSIPKPLIDVSRMKLDNHPDLFKQRDITYWKNNCEEDYISTPISVLRYITELEKLCGKQ